MDIPEKTRQRHDPRVLLTPPHTPRTSMDTWVYPLKYKEEESPQQPHISSIEKTGNGVGRRAGHDLIKHPKHEKEADSKRRPWGWLKKARLLLQMQAVLCPPSYLYCYKP